MLKNEFFPYVKNFKTYQAMYTNSHFKNGLEKLLWTLFEFSTLLLFFQGAHTSFKLPSMRK